MANCKHGRPQTTLCHHNISRSSEISKVAVRMMEHHAQAYINMPRNQQIQSKSVATYKLFVVENGVTQIPETPAPRPISAGKHKF